MPDLPHSRWTPYHKVMKAFTKNEYCMTLLLDILSLHNKKIIIISFKGAI